MKWLMALMLAWTVTFGGPNTAATAQKYTFEQGQVVNVKILACDTLVQARGILTAWRDDGWAGYLSMKTWLNQLRNRNNDVVCGIMRGPMMPLTAHEKYEVISRSGKVVSMYLIQFVLPDNTLVFAISPFPMLTGEPV